MPTDADERFLSGVFRILALSQPTKTKGHYAFAITRHQFAKGGLFATQAARKQRPEVVRHVFTDD